MYSTKLFGPRSGGRPCSTSSRNSASLLLTRRCSSPSSSDKSQDIPGELRLNFSRRNSTVKRHWIAPLWSSLETCARTRCAARAELSHRSAASVLVSCHRVPAANKKESSQGIRNPRPVESHPGNWRAARQTESGAARQSTALQPPPPSRACGSDPNVARRRPAQTGEAKRARPRICEPAEPRWRRRKRPGNEE